MLGTSFAGVVAHEDRLLDELVARRAWMFVPPGPAARGDWPDIAAARAPAPLLVQYNRHDHLFSMRGMTEAHERLSTRYRQAGSPESCVGEFYDGPHKFDRAMQARRSRTSHGGCGPAAERRVPGTYRPRGRHG